jgi:predicted acetyltransferase
MLSESVFETFQGCWEVAVARKNKAALGFWKQVVASYTQGEWQKKKNLLFDGYGFVFNTERRHRLDRRDF